MFDDFNQYLKDRPLLGSLFRFGVVVVGTLMGIPILAPSQSLVQAIFDPVFWALAIIMGVIMGLMTTSTAKNMERR